MDVRVGLWRKLSAKELLLLNCGVGEDSWESLGLQGDPTNPFWRRSAWDFFGRNDAKAEAPVLWPPHAKSWLIGKDSDAGRDWGQEEKGTTEDETTGWHHWLYGCESEWTLWVGDAILPSRSLSSPLILPSILPTIRVFTNESVLRIRWPKYWSFSFSIHPSNEYSGLISFSIDWFDLFAVQGTLKSLLQHHSTKATILWHSAFFIVQPYYSYMTTGKTIALTR